MFSMTTPSTTNSGLEDELMVPNPLINIRGLPEGEPEFKNTLTPDTLPFNPCNALFTGACNNSSPETTPTDPAVNRFCRVHTRPPRLLLALHRIVLKSGRSNAGSPL